MNKRIYDIVGLKVLAIKGIRCDMRRKKGFSPQFIIFDDEKTFIELEEQDYFTYHDCDGRAKVIKITQDDQMWKRIMENDAHFPDADLDVDSWWYYGKT